MAPKFSMTAILLPVTAKKRKKGITRKLPIERKERKSKFTSKIQLPLLNGIEEVRALPDQVSSQPYHRFFFESLSLLADDGWNRGLN